MAKGKKIETKVMVAKVGSSLVGCMSWETPYVRFLTPLNGEVIWHSDNAGGAAWNLKNGDIVTLKGFIYGNHLRRVTVTSADGKIFGMGGN
ncbi:MAG: hypothetical protein V1753_06900 [Pseudomonadota bacterium]